MAGPARPRRFAQASAAVVLAVGGMLLSATAFAAPLSHPATLMPHLAQGGCKTIDADPADLPGGKLTVCPAPKPAKPRPQCHWEADPQEKPYHKPHRECA